MKKSVMLFLLILPLFALWACKDKPASVDTGTKAAEQQEAQQTTAPASTAPAAPASTGPAAPATAGASKGEVNLKLQVVAVQKAVLEFRTGNKRFPASLEELKSSKKLDFDISKYNYDSKYGRVTLKQ